MCHNSVPYLFESIHSKKDKTSLYSVTQPLSDSINAMHYKPAADFLQQMQQHVTVRQYGYERLVENWCEKVTIADK